MELIPLPKTVDIKRRSDAEADIIIEPCYPGYGTTIGNALRRVLLSSMQGAAITYVQIKGITHEFTSLPHVKEDIVELMLNLKGIRVKLHADEADIELHVKGEKTAKAKDIKANSDVEVINGDHVIATLTDKDATLDMTLHVEKGKGYVPVEMQKAEGRELGTIALDAIFTPIKNVNYSVEHVRVGEITNFDRLTLSITTDGSLSPEDAFQASSTVLLEHFAFFTKTTVEPEEPVIEKKKRTSKKATEPAE